MEGAATDARLLLCAAAGIGRVDLLRDADAPLGEAAATTFAGHIARRLAREPVSRILGRRGFWGLDLLVTPAILDPRPDTETLVEAVLAQVGDRHGHPWRILDLGTGSGAILCALLSELPAALGWGVDRSAAACRVARENLARCGLGDRALVVHADWGAPLAPGEFDLVVSNPPYIERAALAGLDPEVRDHDPLQALDGGADGLDAFRALAAQLPHLLAAGGLAALEVGVGQAPALIDLLARAGLRDPCTRHDLAGIERVVTAVV